MNKAEIIKNGNVMLASLSEQEVVTKMRTRNTPPILEPDAMELLHAELLEAFKALVIESIGFEYKNSPSARLNFSIHEFNILIQQAKMSVRGQHIKQKMENAHTSEK